MQIAERLKKFNSSDFVRSYSAKFLAGLGVGLLLPQGWSRLGWISLFLALLIGIGPEIKFFKGGD